MNKEIKRGQVWTVNFDGRNLDGVIVNNDLGCRVSNNLTIIVSNIEITEESMFNDFEIITIDKNNLVEYKKDLSKNTIDKLISSVKSTLC